MDSSFEYPEGFSGEGGFEDDSDSYRQDEASLSDAENGEALVSAYVV
jgi:hypothetical protein